MNPWAIIPFVSFIVFAVLLIVVIPQAKKRTNRLFAIFLFASEIWSFTAFLLLYNVNASTQYLIYVNGLVIAAIPLVVITYYHFLRAYNDKPGGIGVYIGYAVVLVILILSFTGNVVKDAYFEGNLLHHDIFPWEFILATILTPFLTLTLLMLVKRYRNSTDPIDRNRTAYLITGWSILLVISYITPFSPALKTLPTDHIGNLINALIISYAITRFSLLDIRLVARKLLTYIAVLGIVIGISAVIVVVGLSIFTNQPALYIILATALVTFIVIVSARPLIHIVELAIDRIFYRRTYDYRQALLNFSNKMGNILDMDELAKEMMPAMVNAMNITQTKLLFQDNESGDFKVRYAYPKIKGEMENILNFSPDSPLVDWLDKKSNPLYIEQVDNIAELKGLWHTEKEQLGGSGLGVLYPFKSRGKLIGILGLGKKSSGGPYSHEDIQLVNGITNQVGIIIENAQLYHQAKTRANTDELTGLYNHRSFHERMEQEIARGSRFGGTFSLIMLDIDLFKSYNDIYGHLAGDQVLRKVGRYLESSMRSIDLAFRYGGEEFAVILPEARLDDAYKVAERIRKTIESKTSSRAMPITTSLGVGNWPNDGVMKEEVIGLADAALYRAKQMGRNRTCLSSDVLKPDTSLIGVELEARPRALSIIYALAATVDAKDSYTYGHSRKVSEYAVAIAEAYKLTQERISTIRAASLLHDIGKVGVPDSILNKKTPLTEEEWKPIKAHPELGVEILRHVIDLVNCLPAILHHHEHHDGSGYPAGLSGDGIPLEARILAVADAYDAMTSPRPYHEPLSLEEAVEELKHCAGTQFDPEVVEVFCKIIQPPEHPRSLDIRARSEDDTG
ncbi:MAG TPA: diguanylate cyclase [Dehalococcoidia bacterium]|nr:diguanylate cyclase [Dehalococcoidia bacterium]